MVGNLALRLKKPREMDVVTRVLETNLDQRVELDECTAEYLLQSLLLGSSDELDELKEIIGNLLETLVGEEVDVSRCVDELVASREELVASREEVLAATRGEGASGGAEVGDDCLGTRDDCGDKENGDSNSKENSSESSTSSRQDAPEPLESSEDMVALQTLFPQIKTSYLRRLFISNNSELELTANHLLSMSEEELAAELGRMRMADEAGRGTVDKGKGRFGDAGPETCLDESTKAAIKQSFLLEVVPGSGARGKQSRKNLRKNAEFLNAQIAKAANDSRQVRFRDGVVASTKGQKFIVESTKEEWNGGSSGKVYTKGKRGKGFVA